MDKMIATINDGIKRFNAYSRNHHSLCLSIDSYFDLTKADWKHLNLGEFTYRGIYFILGESVSDPSVKVYIGSNLAESSAISYGITNCLPKESWSAGKGYFDDDLQFYFTRVYTLPLEKIGDKQMAKALLYHLKDFLNHELLDRRKIILKTDLLRDSKHTDGGHIIECKSCHQTIHRDEIPAAQGNGGLCPYCEHMYEKEGLMKPNSVLFTEECRI